MTTTSATAAKAVKVGVEARTWYALKQICERRGDIKGHVESAIKTYIAFLDNALVLWHDGDAYKLVDVNEIEFKDIAGRSFCPLYEVFPAKVIKRFVEILAPYVVRESDGRPYRVSIRVTRDNVTRSERYDCDFLYPHIIARHVLNDEPVIMTYVSDKDHLIPAGAELKKDEIIVDRPHDMDIEVPGIEPADLPDPEILADRRLMYVRVKVDGDLWDIFTGLVKHRRGDVSKSLNEALKLYLGGLWNTLALKEYYEINYYIERKLKVANLVFEDFLGEDTNTRYGPVGREFTRNGIRAILRQLGRPYAYMDLHRPMRFKRADELSEEEVVDLVLDDHMVVFQIDKYKQYTLAKNSFGETSMPIDF